MHFGFETFLMFEYQKCSYFCTFLILSINYTRYLQLLHFWLRIKAHLLLKLSSEKCYNNFHRFSQNKLNMLWVSRVVARVYFNFHLGILRVVKMSMSLNKLLLYITN